MEDQARVIRAELKTKRTLVTSDIHGNYDNFTALLKRLEYRPGEDALVVIGDLIQKGDKNLDTLHLMMELSKTENVFLLRGNNDWYVEKDDETVFGILSHFRGRILQGEMIKALGLPFPRTVEEFHLCRGKIEEAYRKELAFLRNLPDILETEKFLFAHAGLQNEELGSQELSFVLAAPRFHETVEHTFSKLLLVGHWPTANYRSDRLCNAPIFNFERNVLSIDGGNRVKTLGQLNGILLNNETGEWSWDYVDSFPKIKAPCSQEYKPGRAITWPDNYVELLEHKNGFSRCRFQKDGTLFEIPDSFLYEACGGGVFRSEDITTARLGVEAGEEISLIWRGEDRMLVMKNGEAGFLLLK